MNVSIDFKKFVKPVKVIVPILRGSFKYNGKEYKVNSSDSGWFEVELQGNKATILNPAIVSSYKKDFNLIRGYVFNEQFIFWNFDVGKRKTNKEVMTDIYFNTCPSFSSVIVVIWEDGKLYYYEPNYKDSFIYTVKNTVESGEEYKDLKGLTPELRTLCLFYELNKQRLEEFKTEQEAEKLRQTLHGRLILSFRRTGAELLRYSISGNRIVVDWKIGNQEFNSVLNKDTFRVIEAGYCCSGEDTLHSVHSLVILADDYQKEGLIYKTRDRR